MIEHALELTQPQPDPLLGEYGAIAYTDNEKSHLGTRYIPVESHLQARNLMNSLGKDKVRFSDVRVILNVNNIPWRQ